MRVLTHQKLISSNEDLQQRNDWEAKNFSRETIPMIIHWKSAQCKSSACGSNISCDLDLSAPHRQRWRCDYDYEFHHYPHHSLVNAPLDKILQLLGVLLHNFPVFACDCTSEEVNSTSPTKGYKGPSLAKEVITIAESQRMRTCIGKMLTIAIAKAANCNKQACNYIGPYSIAWVRAWSTAHEPKTRPRSKFGRASFGED